MDNIGSVLADIEIINVINSILFSFTRKNFIVDATYKIVLGNLIENQAIINATPKLF